MDINASSVKKCCGKEFTKLFRLVLYNSSLTWGSKALFFAILDLPLGTKPKNSKLARKLSSSPSQVSVWRRELRDHKILEK